MAVVLPNRSFGEPAAQVRPPSVAWARSGLNSYNRVECWPAAERAATLPKLPIPTSKQGTRPVQCRIARSERGWGPSDGKGWGPFPNQPGDAQPDRAIATPERSLSWCPCRRRSARRRSARNEPKHACARNSQAGHRRRARPSAGSSVQPGPNGPAARGHPNEPKPGRRCQTPSALESERTQAELEFERT